MNPSKSGLSSAGKTGVVILLVVIVLAAAYLAPSLSKGGGSQSGSGAGEQPITGMAPLFADFPKMQVSLSSYDASAGQTQNFSYSYTVLGTGTLITTTTSTLTNGQRSTTTSSNEYTRVEFTTIGVGNDVIGWYNSSGVIADEEIPGQRNYTGSGVPDLPFMTIYNTAFGGLVSMTNNATVLSTLSKTSQTTKNIGPTSMDVATYMLATRSPPLVSMTVELGTIPGTSVQFAVYVSQKMTDGSTTVLQVTSLTR